MTVSMQFDECESDALAAAAAAVSTVLSCLLDS
jgi:hypothetical protein